MTHPGLTHVMAEEKRARQIGVRFLSEWRNAGEHCCAHVDMNAKVFLSAVCNLRICCQECFLRALRKEDEADQMPVCDQCLKLKPSEAKWMHLAKIDYIWIHYYLCHECKMDQAG